MIELVKVVRVEAMPGHILRVNFTNGEVGDADFTWVLESEWPMSKPLIDPAFFARVFVSLGVPTWPNGFDVDAIQLHREMNDQGRLRRSAA